MCWLSGLLQSSSAVSSHVFMLTDHTDDIFLAEVLWNTVVVVVVHIIKLFSDLLALAQPECTSSTYVILWTMIQ